jgi:hypothetical protein
MRQVELLLVLVLFAMMLEELLLLLYVVMMMKVMVIVEGSGRRCHVSRDDGTVIEPWRPIGSRD